MADIQLAGFSISEIRIDDREICTVLVSNSEMPGGGSIHSIAISSSNSPGWLIHSQSWLGARGKLYIERTGDDGFAANNLEIAQDCAGPYVIMGIGTEQIAVARFPSSTDVAFGRVPGGELRLLTLGDGPILRALDSRPGRISIKHTNALGQERSYEVNEDRFYFASNESEDLFTSLAYMEVIRGNICLRFSCATVVISKDGLRISAHCNNKADSRSLDPTSCGYLDVPDYCERSILFHSADGDYAGTMHVKASTAYFTNGEMAWQE